MQTYQGGAFFEIFTTQGKDLAPNWKIHGGIKKVYEKEVKSYVYNLEGTPATTKMQFPKDSSQSLTLIQRYLIFQLNVSKGQDFSIELGITDLDNNKRRLHFSTAQKETQTTPLHAKIPLAVLRRSIWMNMCIDMVSMVGETWKSQTFKSVYSVCVSANCKLRRVFTMKTQPLDTSGDDEMYGCASSNTGDLDQIPKPCQLPTDVTQITQLLTLTKIKHAERLKGGETHRGAMTLDLDLNASGRKSSLNDSFHIAFGTKIPGGRTVQQTSRRSTQGNMTNRSMRSNLSRMDSRTDDGTEHDMTASIASRNGLLMRQDSEGAGDEESVMYSSRLDESEHRSADQSQMPLHQRQTSDPLSKEDLELYSRIDNSKHDFVQPHPPREPSSDRLRRKIRLKNGNGSANKERVSSAGSLKDESGVCVNTGNTGKSVANHSPSRPDENPQRKRLISDGDHLLVEKCNNSTGRNRSAELARRDGAYSSQLQELDVDYKVPQTQSPRLSKEYNREEYQGEGVEMDDSVSNVIELLKQKAELSDSEGECYSSGEGGGEEYEESDEDERSERGGVFLFASKPKSAPRRHLSPNNLDGAMDQDSLNQSRNSSKGSRSSLKKLNKELAVRGPRPEDDFFNSHSSTDEDEANIRKKLPGSRPTSGTNSRPTSGTNSRPTSGTNRPHSGTNSTVSPKTGSAGHRRSHRKEKDLSTNSNATQITVEHVQPTATESPDLKGNGHLAVSLQVPGLNGSLGSNSMSRMNRKSLREIPKTDARLMKSSEKPYDVTKYQMGDITESFEARMFASMKRQNDEELEDIVESPRKLGVPTVQTNKSPRHPNQVDPNTRHMYDFSPTLTISDDDTSLSTWQAPPNVPHNYREEMQPPRLSTDTLTSSNPREWDCAGMFSPPIPVIQNQLKNSTEDLSTSSNGVSPRKELSDVSPRKAGLQGVGRQDTTDDESMDELDLLYDPCLNCYYDPRSCKYYELI